MLIHQSDADQVSGFRAILIPVLLGYSLLNNSWAVAQQDSAAKAGQDTAKTPAGDSKSKSPQEAKTQDDYDIAQRKLVTHLLRLDNALVTPQIFNDFNKDAKAYRAILAAGTRGRNQKELNVLRSGLKYRILVLSDRTVQEDSRAFETAVKNLTRDLGRCGQLLQNADDKKRFRMLLYQEALPLLKTLTQDNLLARSAVLEILLELEVVSARGAVRMQMFDQIDDVFIKMLQDPLQPDGIKIRVANSIKRFLQKANAIPQVENALASALIKELNRKFISIAYQNTILMALENMNSPRQLVGGKSPLVICAAVDVMTDTNRDIRIRCRAARTVGRAGYDGTINFDPVAWKVAELTLETAVRFTQAADKKDAKWDKCGWYLYTAFHHQDRKEAEGRMPTMPKGFLNRAPKSALVRAAYTIAVPIMAHLMFNDNAIGTKALGPLLNWTNKNPPANLRFDPACPPLKPAAGDGPQG